MAKTGYIDGRHYTTYVEEVKALKGSGNLAAAEGLLIRRIDATEEEARANRCSVAPGYYWHLAIVYRKQGWLADEAGILERYKRVASRRGEFGGKFAEQLEKVWAKLGTTQ